MILSPTPPPKKNFSSYFLFFFPFSFFSLCELCTFWRHKGSCACMTSSTVFDFGKYRAHRLQDPRVPTSYLEWIITESSKSSASTAVWTAEFLDAVRLELSSRHSQGCKKIESFFRKRKPEEKKEHHPKKSRTHSDSRNIFDSPLQAIVNPVNCRGVMGKGLAKQFKQRYPAMFQDYKQRCASGQMKLGQPYIYKDSPDGKWIINFPTKDHWNDKSRLEDLEQGLRCLVEKLSEWKVTSLAVPALGCMNGGLKYEDVLPLLKKYLSSLSSLEHLDLYEPQNE